MPILSLPRILFFGSDSLDEFVEQLSLMGVSKTLVVTDKIIRDLGLLDILLGKIRDKVGEIEVFDEVEPEPSFEIVDKGVEVANKFQPDLIIALGGGSVIDTAKGIWVKYENPDFDLEELSPFVWLNLGRKAQLVAIPTTSGTGSEVTLGVVYTKKGENKKIAVGSYEVVPFYSIVDPVFPKSMPSKLTAITGIDALSHVMESYVAVNSNPFTDALGEKALQLIHTYLPRAYKNGNDIEAREKMHIAATMAGMAFSNSGLGIAHGLAHAFGPLFKVPHGFAVGLFIPYVMVFNASKSTDVKMKYGVLAKVIGVSGFSASELFDGLMEEILRLYESVEAPKNLSDLNIDAEEFRNKMDLIVKHAYEDPEIAFNPVPVTPEDLKTICEKVMEGEITE